MTEQEWNASTDLSAMLDFLGTRRTTSGRKLRLFAAGCCRRVWHWLGERSKHALVVLEKQLDREATLDEQQLAFQGACEDWMDDFGNHFPSNAAYCTVNYNYGADVCARGAAQNVATAVEITVGRQAMIEEQAAQCDLLREIFHGPRRVVHCRSHWRTADVLNLVSVIHRHGELDAYPVLGDALFEAGCENDDVLRHCRQPEHARGCWVLDMLLNRF